MRRWLLWFAAAVAFLPAVASAQDTSASQTLTITMPRADLPSGHRALKAYTGMTYEIPFTVIGGCYPFTFSITNAPSGMTVAGWYTTLTGAPAATGSATGDWGVVTWTNPTSDASNVGFRVIDNCGTVKTETLTTISVTTSGFKFIDAVNGHAAASNGGTGDGSQGNPWLTINDAYENATSQTILYLYPRAQVSAGGVLTGTAYTYTDIPTGGGCTLPNFPETRIDINEASRWSAMIRDPRGSATDEAVINYNFSGTWDSCPNPAYQRIVGDRIWFDGITFFKMHTKGVEIRSGSLFNGWVFWRNKCDTYGPGYGGSNSACLMTANTQSTHRYGSVFVGNRGFRGAGTGDNHTDMLKTYTENALLVAGNTTTGQTSSGTDGEFSIKGTHTWVEVRDNRCYSMASGQACLGGNTAGIGPYEIRYNNFVVSGLGSNGMSAMAIHIGQGPGTVSGVKIFRNTLFGRVRFWNAGPWSGSVDLTRNVVINQDNAQATPYLCDGTSSSTEWGDCSGTPVPTFSLTSNYTSTTSGDIDSNGLLTGTARTNHGPDSATPKGFELATGAAPAPTVLSVSPDNGTTLGGTAVTITGASFVATPTSVTFGGSACTSVTFVSSTSLTCTTPAHAAGAVNVVVTNPDAQTGTGTAVYTYATPPDGVVYRLRVR